MTLQLFRYMHFSEEGIGKTFKDLLKQCDILFIESVAKEIVKERIIPQIKLLDDQVKSINRRSLSYQLITSGLTISSSIFTGGLSLVPWIAIMGAGIGAIVGEGIEWNYKISSQRNNPMYFLWKIKQKTK